jgi:hypothetical protein
MDDKTSMQNTIEAGVTALTLKIDSLTMLALTGTEEDETPDKFSDRGKLVFLSIMSHSISPHSRKTEWLQRGCWHLAGAIDGLERCS